MIPDADRSYTYRDSYTAKQFLVEQGSSYGKYRDVIVTALAEHEFGSVLEAGCAVGALIGRIRDRFQCKCAGFDFSAVAIEEAKRRHPEVDFRVLDVEDMLTAYEPGQFDVILTSAVLQHCGAALFWKACENIVALKPKLVLHLETNGDEKRVRARNGKLYCRHNYPAAYEALGVPEENITVTTDGLSLIKVKL